MTTQCPDAVLFEGEEFSVLEIDDGDGGLTQDFFTPHDFGMRGSMTSTANRKGFSATYELVADTLCLVHFGLCERTENYLPIAGVQANIQSDGSFGSYGGLNLPVEFTGTVRIARRRIDSGAARRTKTRTERPFPYAKVIDLKFGAGRLVSVTTN